MAKKAKHSDAVMTGILDTKFKMGQINIKDLVKVLRIHQGEEMFGGEKGAGAIKRFRLIFPSSRTPSSLASSLRFKLNISM